MMMSSERPRILVTGGAGYIGSHTILQILKADYDVVALDSCVNCVHASCPERVNGHVATTKPPSLQRVEELCNDQVTFVEGSTMDLGTLRQVFSSYEIDVVIHFAALKAVGESINEPLLYYNNNVVGTINLLQVMQEYGVNKLIFSSSATVYGTPQYLPMDEQHPTGVGITNPYGQTKYMCEQILKDLTASNKELQVIMLRYFNPVGAHESGRMGEDPKGVPNNLMPYISQVAVGKRPCLQVFGGDYDTVDGTGVRDYIHVVDLAQGHVDSLRWLLLNPFSGWRAFNLGTGQGVSVLQMIDAYSKAAGKQVKYEIVPRRQGDVANVVASCHLAHEQLGWKATRTLTDMCADTFRWQTTNPNGYSSL